MAARKKTKLPEIASVEDPRAPLDARAFLTAAAPVLALLKKDLHARSEASPAVRAALGARHERERKAERTGDSFAEWRAHFVDQVAAAWLLSCVFVRTLEDRGMLGHARLAGPGAQDSQRIFFELAPSLTERDYLLTVFRELSRFECTRPLFDGAHNPVWMLAPSADAAKALLQLFRSPTADAPAFRFGQADTRFLGDLYQDLDEGARKRFALLQTPDFVERYILDRTLEPAIARFGLEETTLIDPTCGSGHFLLGAFARLFEHRRRAEPDASEREAVFKALSAVGGADINPYAVAIARLRLTLAALEKAGISKLAGAPALPIKLAVADSLLYNPHLEQLKIGMTGDASNELTNAMLGDAYALEAPEAAREVLHRQYAAVVGNPPYITCKDPALRERYRKDYASAAGKFALAAPFCERFFQLGRDGGSIGMITANSFMKREFGKKLIEEVLADNWNLTRVENTSGAYIPGHGTPTVLLFGTAEKPQGTTVHAILSNRGEPSTPADPSRGLVWTSLVEHGDEVGFENEYITVARVERDALKKHPWSLGGGGASDLKEMLEERAEKTLKDVVDSIGIASFTLEDEVYLRPSECWMRSHVPTRLTRPMVIGEAIRDWSVDDVPRAFFPYDGDLLPLKETAELRPLWPWRACLANNKLFGGTTKVQGGLKWYEYGRLTTSKLKTPLTITFAFVATHNHFVLDRGDKVFKQSAPIIKLPEGATEEDHLALLAYLNSSTACFWMKQVFYPKATTTGDISVEKGKPEANRYEFAGTGLQALPIPRWSRERRLELATLAAKAEQLAAQRESLSAAHVIAQIAERGGLLNKVAEQIEAARAALLAQLVGLQEDIDWLVYSLFGLSDLVGTGGLQATPEQRPFAVRMGADIADVPGPLPAGWKARLDRMQHTQEVRFLEDPMFKRPWEGRRGVFGHGNKPFVEHARDAAHGWIASKAEGLLAELREPRSVASVARLLLGDAAVLNVCTALAKDDAPGAVCHDVLKSADAVPFLAAYRFTDSGLEKYAEWQRTWDLQRREDAGERVGAIPVPPKYAQKDYRDATYWRLRGKLDVPKERFISYPGCESDEDGEPVFGWAGWNHLEQAQALAALYNDRKDREGWAKERLLPVLAGILELLPWLKQWHNEPNADFDGLRLGDYFDGFLQGEMRSHGVTAEELTSIRPEARSRRTAKAPSP